MTVRSTPSGAAAKRIGVTATQGSARKVTGHWVEHYGHAAAGAVIASVGILVAALGR